MTDSGTPDQVQATLAAFFDGTKTLAELEVVLAAALHSGLWSPALVMVVLRDAVAAGRIPRDTLRRLGLEEAGDPTVARPPSESVDSATAGPVPRESVGTGQLLGGRYRLGRKLGEGGMGVVYEASDQEVEGEIFAIKVLTPEIRERPDALELLRDEVRKTRTLAHPNIVGVYSLNVDRTGVFILMERLEGKTLQALLDEDFGRGMRFDRAWPIIEDLGAALAYAHDHSVIHGDLKPANVFVTTAGRAKLLDFGIARAARGSRWGKDAAALGALTPAYASCEMLEYLPPDTRDDVYALACIIYEMLSGRHPFDRHNAVEARDAGEKPLPITALTDQQNAALEQGLAFDRAARTATVEMLLAGLAPGAPAKPWAVFSRTTGIAALIVIVAATLVYFIADGFRLSKHVATEQPATSAKSVVSDKSIAVLPFIDMSEKKDQEYFADGMAEEILDLLAKIPGLTVIGRTSSFQFKGKSDDLRSIGTKLNAAYILEGSVRKASDRLRVTAQLIESQSGAHLWSDTYDRDMTDVLKLQDEIAAGIARALEVTVGAHELRQGDSIKNMDAYRFYLLGLHAIDRYDKDSLDEAASDFQKSLDIDPALANAAGKLADTRAKQAILGFIDYASGFEDARRMAENSIRLAPSLAIGHAVLALYYNDLAWDWAAADREAKRAIALDPQGVYPLTVSASLAATLGRWDEAIGLLNTALALDPLSADLYWYLGNTRYRQGRLPEAETAFRRALQISPTYVSIHFELGRVLLARGQLRDALSAMEEESPEPASGRTAGLCIVYFALGRHSDSDAALRRLETENWPFGMAEAHAFRGEADKALHWLDRAYTAKDELYLIKGDPMFEKIDQDPRYKAFLRKMNLPE
jgi:TolB-like protein